MIEAIDLFCGAGGLTHGLLNAGLDVKAGFDIDGNCKHAYEKNNRGARFFEVDVANLKGEELDALWTPGALRLLAGCAPCQPFSSAAHGSRPQQDPRYPLLEHFTRLVKSCKPHYVTMENVPSVRGHKPFIEFVATLEELGYSVWFDVVACVDYGVPQYRRRLVLIASRTSKEKPSLARRTQDRSTVAQALAGVSKLEAGGKDPTDPIHFARSLTPKNLERIRCSRPGGTWRDWPVHLRADCHVKDSGASYQSVYARMRSDDAAPTMTTQFFNFGTGRFGHPIEDRAITPREAAILQSFPSDYEFVAPGEPVFMARLGKMIGNAVPPKLSEAIGRTLIDHASTAPTAGHVFETVVNPI